MRKGGNWLKDKIDYLESSAWTAAGKALCSGDYNRFNDCRLRAFMRLPPVEQSLRHFGVMHAIRWVQCDE